MALAISVKTFIKSIKLRLTDIYVQQWLTDINSSNIYEIYISFKSTIEIDSDMTCQDSVTNVMTYFYLYVHYIGI